MPREWAIALWIYCPITFLLLVGWNVWLSYKEGTGKNVGSEDRGDAVLYSFLWPALAGLLVIFGIGVAVIGGPFYYLPKWLGHRSNEKRLNRELREKTERKLKEAEEKRKLKSVPLPEDNVYRMPAKICGECGRFKLE